MIVVLAASDAARLAGTACRAVRAERAKIVSTESGLQRKRNESLVKASEERAYARLLDRTLPFIGTMIARPSVARALEHDEKAETLLTLIEAGRRRLRALDNATASLESSEEHLLKAMRAIPHLGVPPKAIEERARAISGHCSSLLKGRRSMEWSTRSVKVSRECVMIVKDWAQLRMRTTARQRPFVPAPSIVERPVRRIYLPIPSAMASSARELGAKRDDVPGRGVSPWYVESNMDLAPFRHMLPLAYRPEPTQFSFPPIPYKASGQNLWTFFDKDTWRRIRSAATDASGSRCIVCGGRGGFIADKVLGAEEQRHGVDCHEVWDWDVQDPATGIGVQSLKRLLVVCPSCHACFHSGYFTKRGTDVGLGDEVKDHIAKRRMLINRMGADELVASLEASKEALSRAQGVDRWIVDLENVGRQQFVTDHMPIMNERNSAVVPPERIAGIAFETQSGERYAARSAQEIYMELAGIVSDTAFSTGMR